MSTRLDQALAEIAGAAGGASRLAVSGDASTATVRGIAARVRRRRAVRATAGGAVAASAAGAVALVAPGLGSAVVAARPDAPAGACGSSLAGVPVDAEAEVALRVFPAGSSGVGGGAPGTDLGTWAGSVVMVDVEEPVVPGAERAAGDAELDVVVAAGDLVVSTVTASVDQRMPYGSPDLTSDPAGEVWSAGGLGVPLEACDDGERLPAGPYTVWTVRTADDGDPELTGPWPIAVAPAPKGLGMLPEGFPRDLPVVGTRIVAVGPHGPGWGIEVTADGADRAEVAALALRDDGAVPRTENLDDTVLRTTSGWDVRVLPSVTPDGETSVVYDVRPVR